MPRRSARFKRHPHPIKGVLVMRRITQDRFAQMVGYSQEYISQVHNGHKPAPQAYRIAACNALKLNELDLFIK